MHREYNNAASASTVKYGLDAWLLPLLASRIRKAVPVKPWTKVHRLIVQRRDDASEMFLLFSLADIYHHHHIMSYHIIYSCRKTSWQNATSNI